MITFVDGQVIDSADVNANFEEKVAAMNANAKRGRHGQLIRFRALAYTSAASVVFYYTPQTDVWLRYLQAYVVHAVAGTTSLSVTTDDGDFLIQSTLSVQAATAGAGTARASSAVSQMLLKNVRYKITISSSVVGAQTLCEALLGVQSFRRRGVL